MFIKLYKKKYAGKRNVQKSGNTKSKIDNQNTNKKQSPRVQQINFNRNIGKSFEQKVTSCLERQKEKLLLNRY